MQLTLPFLDKMSSSDDGSIDLDPFLPTLDDIYEAVEFHLDYTQGFETDLCQTVKSWNEHMQKFKSKLKKLRRPHPCPTATRRQLSRLIRHLTKVERLFPMLEAIPEELISMKTDIQQISKAINHIKGQK